MSDKAREDFEEWLAGKPDESFVVREIMFHGWLAAKEKYGPRWIKVSERMPEPGQRVWYFFDAVGVFYGTYDGDGTSNQFSSRWGFLNDDVTHWMPAPIAPSTQGGGE